MNGTSRQIRVLIIEDNIEYLYLLKKIFDLDRDFQFDVKAYNTLGSGLENLSGNHTDIILLDVNLPDSNGIDTIRTAYASSGNIPIVVMTANENENLLNEAIKLGVQDFIIKGEISNSALIRTVIIAVERQRAYKNKFISSQFKTEERYYKKILENNSDAMLVLDKNGDILFSNDAANDLFANDDESIVGKNFSLSYNSELPTEIDLIDNNGEKLVFEMRNTRLELMGETTYIASFIDITERKLLETKLRDLSNKDDITNLLNKRGFEFLANQHYKLAERQKSGFLIAFFDLDNLKKINDTYGHIEGTRVIIETSRIISKTFRSADMIARFGGDEFIVLGTNTDKNSKNTIISRLQKNIDDFNKTKKLPVDISISTGISYFNPESPKSLQELISEADRNMYEIKNRKKNSVKVESDGREKFNQTASSKQ